MDYKQQYAWLVSNGFVETDINSIVWHKKYDSFIVELWTRRSGGWELSILDNCEGKVLDDIGLFSFPDDFDFNLITQFITSLNKLNDKSIIS